MDDTKRASAVGDDDTTFIPGQTEVAEVRAWSQTDDHEPVGLTSYDDGSSDEQLVHEEPPRLSRKHRELLKWLRPDDEVWTDEDDAAYTRNTVVIFVSLIGVALVGAVYLCVAWSDDHHQEAAPVKSWVTEGQATSAPTPDTEGPSWSSRDRKFLSLLHQGPAYFSDLSDVNAVNDARLICNDLTHKASTMDVQVSLGGISPQDFAWFQDTAIAHYCPRRKD